MGNIGSQTGHISQRSPPEEQWAHSFPRTQTSRLSHQLKVLPERDARQKLRPTNNGEILHSGGTLSGRQNRLPLEINNPQRECREHSPPVKTYFSNERDPLHKSRPQGVSHRQNVTSQKALQEQMKLFVSEPDLRYSSAPAQNMKERKIKKKYKAPPPPHNYRMNEKLEWEENSSDTDFPARKPRLFKTRAETKKNSSHVSKPSNVEYIENADCNPKTEPYTNLRSKRLSLPELKLGTHDDFQRELKEATKRLRHIQAENKNTTDYETTNKNYANNKEKLKTLNHNVSETENVKKKNKEMVEVDDNKNIIQCVRGEASGKESSTPEASPNLIIKDIKSREQPKTFYFGMEELVRNSNIVDHFATNLHQISKIPNSSESDISSDMGSDENNVSKIEIDLQLRPILPKKQLEIPRFSPAAAWRLLSTVETIDNTVAGVTTDDGQLLVEERIEKFSRPPPPSIGQIGQRSTHDKSGDSGISGDDAVPTACYDENPENGIIPGPTTSYLNTQERISWTPQQDLGDDSSLEECINNDKSASKTTHSGPHLFSLSLPRDNQLASYMIEKANPQYSGLQKLKRSVSGVLNNLSNKKDIVQANLTDEESVNWFLSKSAPNSVSNGFHSLEVRKSQDSDQMYSSGMNKTSRVMYLPEAEHNIDNAGQKLRDDEKDNRPDYMRAKCKMSIHSKSCEDIITKIKTAPEALQDLPVNEEYPWKSNRKSKKFTFQSTIRQIEKKRLSEKLSREAERREKKRLRELEAMQKVEEEFQKKRAREKASIRQQLRLYCMDEDPAWSSLPPNLEIKDEVRPEPDGAISPSSTSSSPLPIIKSNNKHFLKYNSPDGKQDNKMRPTATQELSEYRQTQRDYKEYRGSIKYINEVRYPKQTTVYPQVTCNMPKAKGTKVGGGNYRKDFAFGVKSTMSAASTYSEDSQNNSQVYHNKYAPITRF